MMRAASLERKRYLVLVSDGSADTKIPLPKRANLPSDQKLFKALSRVRESVNFEKGTVHEPALYAVHMLYIMAASTPAEISSAVFQKDVLASLQKLIMLYRYHVPTSNEVKAFAKKAIVSKSQLQYNPSLFSSPEEARRLEVFGLSEANTDHPGDVLKKFLQPITFDVLSNIYICKDPFCSLSALDDASTKKYSGAVMEILSSVESNLQKTNQLTWISFASGNLGLTLLRMHVVLNMLQQKKPEDWPAIEVVLIDPRYREAIEDIAGAEKPDHRSISERIAHDVTVGALHQFSQFIAARTPDGSRVAITVCQSGTDFINYNIKRGDSGLGTCYLECDDVWEPHGSCGFDHTDTAVPDYEELRAYVGKHAVNGKYLLIAKNDRKQEAKLVVGDLVDYASPPVTEEFTFKEPFRKKLS
jgi:hypothetical protein